MPLYPRRQYYGRGSYRRSYGRSTYSGRGSYYRRSYRGRGSYTLDNGPWAGRGAAAGGALASAFGIPSGIGEWIGRRALHYPAKYFGSGSYRRKTYSGRGSYRRRTIRGRGNYEVSENNGTMAPEIPRFTTQAGDDSIMVAHREYIGDIYTSSVANTFAVQTFDINPGNPTTFPWLSTLAQCSYQQYWMQGCVFEFISSSGESIGSTNTALGVVIACVNYDANDPDYNSRMEMENSSWANSCKPSQNMSIPVECDPKMTAMRGLLYIQQNGNTPSGADPKTYVLGKVSIATAGFQAASVHIGSLFVTYKCKLMKPFMSRPLANAHIVQRYRSGVTSAIPFGTAFTTEADQDCDTLGMTVAATTLTIAKEKLQVGMRLVLLLEWICASGATTTPAIAFSTNATGITAYGTLADDSRGYAPTDGVTTARSMYTRFVVINDDNSDLVFTASGGTFPASAGLGIHLYQVCGTPAATLGIQA